MWNTSLETLFYVLWSVDFTGFVCPFLLLKSPTFHGAHSWPQEEKARADLKQKSLSAAEQDVGGVDVGVFAAGVIGGIENCNVVYILNDMLSDII